MTEGLFHATIEVPYLLIYTVVIVIGLLSWVIVWSKEGKLDMRDRCRYHENREGDSKDTAGR